MYPPLYGDISLPGKYNSRVVVPAFDCEESVPDDLYLNVQFVQLFDGFILYISRSFLSTICLMLFSSRLYLASSLLRLSVSCFCSVWICFIFSCNVFSVFLISPNSMDWGLLSFIGTPGSVDASCRVLEYIHDESVPLHLVSVKLLTWLILL